MKLYGVWIDGPLPRMFQLCIRSWQVLGYDVALFVYEDTDGVPDGVQLLDAREVLPEIYRYDGPKRPGSPTLTANLIRYNWMADSGGTFIDLDMFAFRELPAEPVIISSAPWARPPHWVSNFCVMRAPAGAGFVCTAREMAMQLIRDGCRQWGKFGPLLYKEALGRVGMDSEEFVSPPGHYYPVANWLGKHIWEPYALPMPYDSYAMHLSHGKAIDAQIDRDGQFHPESLYERLWRLLLDREERRRDGQRPTPYCLA